MNSLTKLTQQFIGFLGKKAVEHDHLLKKSPSGVRIEPEMTEELDELVKDSLHLVILLERSFVEFQRESVEEGNQMGQKLADNVLSELEEIETSLSSPELLNFDLNTESSVLDTVDQSASMINSVLQMMRDKNGMAPEFRKLDQKVYRWIGELIENNDKLYDKATGQSSFYENTFRDDSIRLKERDERHVDNIDPTEIHPDYNTGLVAPEEHAHWQEQDDLENEYRDTVHKQRTNDWTESAFDDFEENAGKSNDSEFDHVGDLIPTKYKSYRA